MKKLKRYLIVPIESVSLEGHKLFYLAGPDKGAEAWQKKAMTYLQAKFPAAYFAFFCSLAGASRFRRVTIEGKENRFPNDQGWRDHYMNEAAFSGCLIFWLGPKGDGNEEEIDFVKNPYGSSVLREEVEWVTRLATNPSLSVVIGVHHSFPDREGIAEHIYRRLGRDFTVHPHLNELLAAAAERFASRP